ncbi:hypothetical protein ACFX2C_031352 [Malus domestica]
MLHRTQRLISFYFYIYIHTRIRTCRKVGDAPTGLESISGNSRRDQACARAQSRSSRRGRQSGGGQGSRQRPCEGRPSRRRLGGAGKEIRDDGGDGLVALGLPADVADQGGELGAGELKK